MTDSENSTEQTDQPQLTFEEAFELTGHGRFNHTVLLAGGLVLLNVNMECLGVGYVITAAECDLFLTPLQEGLISASTFVGIMSTSLLWGYLSDKLGRRAVMLPCLVISAFLSVASSFATIWWLLMIIRLITGFFISASSATVYAYMGEMHITSQRSTAIAWASSFISLAFIFLPALSWLILPGDWKLSVLGMNIKHYQVLMWWWCVPGLCSAAIMFFLPESPKFLIAHGSPEEAYRALIKMYAWNHGGDTNFPVNQITPSEGSGDTSFSRILWNIRPPLLRCTLISHSAMFGVFLISSGLYVWLPKILNCIMHSTESSSNTICYLIEHEHSTIRKVRDRAEDVCVSMLSVQVFPICLATGLYFAVMYLSVGFAINRIGKVPLFCALKMTCGLLITAVVYIPHTTVACYVFVLGLCLGSAASILAALGVDVYPTSMRAMAMCTLYMCGRAGAAFGANVVGVMLEHRLCKLAFTLFGMVTAVTALLIFLWPNPEKVREEVKKKGFTY